MILAERIKTIMNVLELNVVQVANKSGLPPTSVQSIVRGLSKNPGVELLKGLSKAFDLSIDYIVSDEEINLEVILAKRIVSKPDAVSSLDLELYKDALLALEARVKLKNLNIAPDMRKYYVNKIYEFCIKRSLTENAIPKIDITFIDWILENNI